MRITVQQSDIPERLTIDDIGKRMALCFGPYAYPATFVKIEFCIHGGLFTFDVPGIEISSFTD